MNGIANIKNIALDSNVFIYQFEENPDFISFTTKVFEKLKNGDCKAITSVISIIEALSYPSPPKVVREISKCFLSLPNLTIFDVNQQISFEAAKIRRKYGFRLPDSIQLATAKINKAKIFISNDQRLKKFKGVKVILLTEV